MGELLRRRELILPSESGPIWLYNEGEVSPIIGGWNTTGYKYGSDAYFPQSIQPTYLQLGPTNQYNNKGGRTFTSNNRLPASLIGKTLHVVGTMGITMVAGGRDTYAYVFISDDVVDDSSKQFVGQTGAFVAPKIYKYFAFTSGTVSVPVNTVKDFELVLPITQDGYLSVCFYKGHNGQITTKFMKIWAE